MLGIQTVPIAYLLQGKSFSFIRLAMKVVGIENGASIIRDRYPELVNEESINKVTFVYVLEEEHKRVGFSYHWNFY